MAARGGGGRDLARITFGVLTIGLLLAGTLWVLRPFLGPTIWAAMVVVASWPLMRRAERLFGNRRSWAVALMTLLLLLLFVVPLAATIVTIVGNADRLVEWARLAAAWRPPEQAPQWLHTLPVIGGALDALWAQARALGLDEMLPKITPYAGEATRWFVREVGSLGVVLFQFLLTVAIAAVLYARGEQAAAMVRRFARRLGAARGEAAVQLAGDAIRGVALGVGVTALVQAVVAGLGLALAGIPFAGLLTAVMFMLCIAHIGPLPVLVPAIAWAFYEGRSGWAVFLIVVAVVAATIDNVLKPVLIRMGADLPLLLIFAGVVGGLLAFGLVGIFVGPVVLAVAYKLLDDWMSDEGAQPPAAGEWS